MATTFDERIIDAAGFAMKELKKSCNPHEAQIAIAFMNIFICSQYNIPVETYTDVMRSNMVQAGADPIVINRIIERVHNISAMNVQVAGSLN